MTSPLRSCASCATPVPEGALYCPVCGEATPTEISRETGTVRHTAIESNDEAEQREHIQRALGDSFEIGRLIGRGGFAEVYAVTDLKLQRTVAAKVLRPDLVTSRNLVERFLREARAAAKLRHQHIIPIYQVGPSGGLAYFLMPFIEGESLRAYMERLGPLPIVESRRILSEVAQALAVAHEAGLVHRDVKPDNIMLEGKERRAIVTDFGIAKALGRAEPGLTGTGMIVGTPHYMSPEQASGSPDIDERSDLYSLGVLAYQMLAGRVPFEGDSAPQVLVQHLTAIPPAIRELRPEIPQELANAVHRCLEKDASKRWASAQHLATALEWTDPALSPPRGGPGVTAVRSLPTSWPSRRVFTAIVVTMLALAVVAGWRKLVAIKHEGIQLLLGRSPVAGSAGPTLGEFGFPRGSIVSVGDSALVAFDDQGDGYTLGIYDGASWRRIRGPTSGGGALLETSMGVAVLPSPITELMASARPGLLDDCSASVWRLESRTAGWAASIPLCPSAAWSQDSVAVIADRAGRVAWRRHGRWAVEPLGTRRGFRKIFGRMPQDLYALTLPALGTPYDSTRPHNGADGVLHYNGAGWEPIEPRADTSERWTYYDGNAMRDGSMAIVGRACQPSTARCDALLLVRDSGSAPWRRVNLALAPGFALVGVVGTSVSDLLVAGMPRAVLETWSASATPTLDSVFVGSPRRECDSVPSCLYVIRSGVPRAITTFSGQAIRAVAMLHGEPIVLAAGALWRRHDDAWGFASSVPGWRATSFAESESADTSYQLEAGDGFVSGTATFGDVTLSVSYPFERPLPVRRILIHHTGFWVLGAGGRLIRVDCHREVHGSCLNSTVLAPGRGEILDIALASDDSLLGVGRGTVAYFAGGRWSEPRLPGRLRNQIWRSIAIAGDRTALAADTVILLRTAKGVWEVGPRVPRWLWNLERVLLLGDSGLAVANATRLGISLRDQNSFAEALCPWGGRITSLRAMRNGSLAVASADTLDPLRGGAVTLVASPIGRDAVQRSNCVSVKLPRAVNVYHLWADSSELSARGEGLFLGTAEVAVDTVTSRQRGSAPR